MTSIGHKPMRLPPVRSLRVKDPRQVAPNTCLTIMSQLLSCWASGGTITPACVPLEISLRKCMDGPPDAPPPQNNINYHLKRMYEHIVTAKRRKT